MGTGDTRNGVSVGATETSFGIIEHIGEQEKTGVSELADALDVSKSTVQITSRR